jgi:hypothetical protein
MMKSILFSFVFIFTMLFTANAQQLELIWNDEKLPDTVGVYGDAGGDFELVFEAYLKNGTDQDLRIAAARETLSAIDGTDNSFCWAGNCYSPMTDTSSAEYDMVVPAGQVSGDFFSGHYTHANKFGETVVKYTLFERGNVDNNVTVVVVYKYSLTGIDNNAEKISVSDVYPNPASNMVTLDYNLAGANSASVKIVNLLGSVVKSVNLSTGSNKATIDVSDLTQGVYFYSVVVDGNIYRTKKLIVN